MIDMDLSDAVIVKSSRLKSVVWNDFDRLKKGEMTIAVCKHCKKKLSGSSTSGTSHLRNHLIRCQRRSSANGISQFFSPKELKKENTTAAPANLNPDQERRRDEIVSIASYKSEHDNLRDGIVSLGASSNFDQRRSRYDLARMIILHGYPLTMVEHHGFRVFVKNLQPNFELMSLSQVEADCVEIYVKEKQKVFELLDKLPGRISISCDGWTASYNDEYLCLTAHYIDEAWQLKKKILSFIKVDPSQTLDLCAEFIIKSFMDWDIDRKLFSATFDNGLINDDIVARVMNRLSQNRLLYCEGNLFDVRCAMNLVTLIVQDVIEALGEATEKIRKSVRYINSSQEMQGKFNDIAIEIGFSTEIFLCLDNMSQWNSTYTMLETAFEYKKVFSLLQEHDQDFTTCPSDLEWDRIGAANVYLKKLVEVTNVFVRNNKYPTANIYFPEVCEFHFHLIEWCKNPDDFISSLAIKMRSKFDEYWGKCSMVLAVAAVLDPRYKMKLLEYHYTRLYGNSAGELLDDVAECIKKLYNEHSIGSPLASLESWDMDGVAGSSKDRLMGFDRYLHETSQVQSTKSDLDKYLEEPLFPRVGDFDILNWWKVHTPSYPILSMMARNILASPMSKVTGECAFSTREKTLNQNWSLLPPTTLEALMCSQDWISSEL